MSDVQQAEFEPPYVDGSEALHFGSAVRDAGDQLSDVGTMPHPWWTTDRSWTRISPLVETRIRLRYLSRRYIKFRGNKIEMLRAMGVRIGAGTAIINNVIDFGEEPWLIEIGDRVTITRGVIFINHDGSSRIFRHLVQDGSKYGNRFGPIRVLDNSFIGVNSLLLPNVTIGPNSIVGAGSVVTQDVPPGTVAVGAPARVVCTLDEHVQAYQDRMIPVESVDRAALRSELTNRFFGEER